MVAKFYVVIAAAPLGRDGKRLPARIVLVKRLAGKSSAAAERHARAWFEAAYPDYQIQSLDGHTERDYEAVVADLEGASIG